LSVFRGGFTRQAAQSVAGASLHQLANLANKSLLSASPDRGRYYVHELLRQYGEEVLRDNPSRYKSARAAHDRFYAAFMDQAWSRILHNEQREALQDIEADIENVRTAWRHLVARGDPADALRMVRSLWFIHEIRGWHVAADEIFAEAIRRGNRWPHSDSLRSLVAMSESAQGWFAALLGRPEAGVVLAERATSTLRELGLLDELAFAFIQMFMSLYLSAQPAQMKKIGQEALELTDDPWIGVNVHNWLSYISTIEGNFDEQEQHLALVEKLIGSTRDYWVLYWLHLSRALSALEQGDIAACRAILEHTLTNARTINMRRGIHHTLYNLGITARSQEDCASAWAYFLESMQLSEELGSTTDLVGILIDLAVTLSVAGETEQALEMAATAFAHPLSIQITVMNTEPMHSRAEALRSSIANTIASDVAEAAWRRGLASDFDSLVANLIETSSWEMVAKSGEGS
jgi:tetratricopeptide (TPR) repeat protein